ncbi:MAG: DUF3426 domain-containing protein [Rhodoferax sp.]|nr:DUF3426 domain-containing protein [Rhodoferax sp.]
MSLITRCPACETMFKVVPDQLRVSDGWVRCGQCDEIFDASASMVHETPGVAGPGVDAGAHWALTSASDRADAGAKPVPPTEPSAIPATAPPAGPASTLALASEPSILKRSLDQPSPTALAQAASPVEPSTDLGGRRKTDQGLDGGEAPSGEARRRTDPAPARLSFMPERVEPSIWRRSGVRAALGVSCVALLLGLCAQVVYVERDRIAAMEPSVKPWLVTLCEWQGCTISPLQRIESIVIESSSFNKLRGDVYRLNFSVRSAAAIDLAMPAVELTLTDSQDQVLTRRVFLGTELGAKTTVLTPGAEWQGSWGISVKGAGITDHISGYRILAFYP